MTKVFLLFVKECNTEECTHLGIFSTREKAERAIFDCDFNLGTFEEFFIDEFELDVLD